MNHGLHHFTNPLPALPLPWFPPGHVNGVTSRLDGTSRRAAELEGVETVQFNATPASRSELIGYILGKPWMNMNELWSVWKGYSPKLWQWEIRWLATGFEVYLRYTSDQTNPHAVFQYQQRECGLPTKTDDLPEWTWCFSTIFLCFFCDQPTWWVRWKKG